VSPLVSFLFPSINAAFVIPVFEKLFRARWTSSDGCGAIIISPTRELALQIFEVVKSVGSKHFGLTAGVVCGGNPFVDEQAAISKLCVVVATPGRLLQHLEQTPDFDVSSCMMLVLDEADRLLDMGFSEALNNILTYLPQPPQRQTLLFSATQTKSVKDLARLSLQSPQYLSVHEAATTATPAKLQQTYVLCRLQDKLNLLYSFIRTHLTAKTIVFLSSCKQSRFVFEAFRRLRPGVPLQLLHGKMKQKRRMLVYYDFLKKPSCVLFATDIAARGLDFPSVDWVLQLDAPEDVATYIHRAGRTARFKSKGHSMMVLLPNEAKGMLPALEGAKIPLTQVKINPTTAVSITGKIAAEVAADPELKNAAQKCFSSYVRSVYLQTNKSVFDVSQLPLQEYAESLGLAIAPKVKISKKALKADPEELRAAAHAKKNENKALAALRAEAEKEAEEEEKKLRKQLKKMDKDSDSDDDDVESDDSDDSDSSEDSDDSSDDDEDGGAAGGTGAMKRTIDYEPDSASLSSEADEDDDGELDDGFSDEDDDDEGGATAKRPAAKRRKYRELVASSDEDSDEEDEDGDDEEEEEEEEEEETNISAALASEIPKHVLASMNDKERARLFAIIRDTKLLSEKNKKGGDKKGKDGLTPFQRIAIEKAKEVAGTTSGTGTTNDKKKKEDISTAAEDYAARVAAKLKKTAEVDKEREKERIRGKHREDRLRAKGVDPKAGDDDDEEEQPWVEEEEEEESSSSSSGSSSDSSASSSSDDSSSDDDEEERAAAAEAAAAAAKRRAMVMVAPAATTTTKPAAATAASGKPKKQVGVEEEAQVSGSKRKAPYDGSGGKKGKR
jgi:ATP-dependent RNA helicase DDX10/DBP4